MKIIEIKSKNDIPMNVTYASIIVDKNRDIEEIKKDYPRIFRFNPKVAYRYSNGARYDIHYIDVSEFLDELMSTKKSHIDTEAESDS